MKTVLNFVCVSLALWMSQSNARAASAFSSGSNGSYGPMNISSNTVLDLPPDGIFHCTTITVAPNMTLSFKRNALNTPVYLLATGDVSINGTVDVSGAGPIGAAAGAGGPGGFDGGYGGFGVGSTAIGGDGQGPGGGSRIKGYPNATFAVAIDGNTNVYGNALLVPLIGGSGSAGGNGNPGTPGGGGGGAILIASDAKVTVSGAIVANGAFGNGAGSGSGGGIRLVSPLVTGSGVLRARSFAYGPNGRIRIDCLDRVAYRTLQLDAAGVTRGSQMFVFPAVVPRLDILQAAGKAIPEGTASEMQVELPVGASTNQSVVVQGRGFTGTVPLQIVVVPEVGPSTRYPAQLDMNGGSTAQTTVNVVIPAGILTRIFAWSN